MIKKTLTEWELQDELEGSFSKKASSALYDYFNELEEDVELDPVGWRGKFSEYTLPEFNEEYEGNYKSIDDVIENFNEGIIIPIDDKSFLLGQ